MNYGDVCGKSYFELEKELEYRGKTPLSVHFPLNFPYSNALIYSDCAFNIFSLPIPPDMNSREITCAATLEKIMVQMVSFLFDDPAFIPEYRQVRLNRQQGGYPLVHGSLYACEKKFEVDLCPDPLSKAVYAKVSVTNCADECRKAVVRTFQSRTIERDFMDYHYYPFRFDAEKFSRLVKDENTPLIVDAGKFEVVENDSFAFGDEEYNLTFKCSHPYIVEPAMRVKSGDGCTKFCCELQPEERASFTIAVCFDGCDKSKIDADFETVCKKSCQFWDSLLTSSTYNCTDKRGNDIFRALQWGSLQLLLDLDSPKLGRICQPSQGGTSERFYVWVWEAMCCLRPMLTLGHFAPVRKVIEFIFKLQDGGCPPDGNFQSLQGAIGTTGPRWANASGSALVLASEYALLSADEDFCKEYLPKMLRAARWILNEVKATQKYNPDGSKQLGFGVMPMCCATDGDFGYIIVSTDLWSLAGVEAFAKLLKKRNDPAWSEIDAAANEYRQNLSDAIDSVRHENGFIDRKLSNEGRIAKSFAICSGALKLLNVFGDPCEERFGKLIKYYEDNLFRGRFCGPMFDRINYIGNIEANLFTAYLKRGEWKKAHLAAATFRKCGMSADLYLTQERFSEVDDAYTPWQPNASNNGRYLQMVMDSLFLVCNEREFILCGGVTPESILKKECFSLKNIHTPDGIVSLTFENGILSLSRSRAFAKGTCFVLPDYLRVKCEGKKKEGQPDNHFIIGEAASSFTINVMLETEKLFI